MASAAFNPKVSLCRALTLRRLGKGRAIRKKGCAAGGIRSNPETNGLSRDSRGWALEPAAAGARAQACGARRLKDPLYTKSARKSRCCEALPTSGDAEGIHGQNMLKSKWSYLLGGLMLVLGLAVWKCPPVSALASKSGFSIAFSLIFISELGDKTFFLAALLAAQRPQFLVLIGAMAALSVMTVISVQIGCIFQKLPIFVNSSVPITEYLSAALLLIFGLQTLKVSLSTTSKDSMENEELDEAKEAVQRSSLDKKKSLWSTIFTSFVLIFTAEWGDRSMFATVALVASQNPVGVCAGAIAGHLLATLIAIMGGTVVGKFLSEKSVGIAGGVLYIVFALATIAGVF